MRVLIPFGSRKIYDVGYVIDIKEKSDYKCKNIIKVVDQVLSEDKLKFAHWISDKYFCNLSEAIRLMVPPGTATKYDNIKVKTEKYIYLNNDFNLDFIKKEKQKKVIEFLQDNVGYAPKSIVKEMVDVSDAVLKTLEKNKVIAFKDIEVSRNPLWNKNVNRSNAILLTNDQRKALESIKLDEYKKYLIHGVTGSGKTEIYLQLIEKVLNNKKTAIVLVPEISLTPQITDRFLSRFGNIIAVLHSGLSLGERYDEWNKINSGNAKVVIGARSAIFAPIKNLGVIIIDEEHDSSYKSEVTPKYDAKELATQIAITENIPLVLRFCNT